MLPIAAEPSGCSGAAGGRFDLLDLDVGEPAAGGSCVARHDGRVVFVRHALPGERVRVHVTEDAGRFLRADALEVVAASPDRVVPPCPHAHPGGCGGCDWQHASGAAQRRIKATVVREQFRRIAGLPVDVAEAEPLPGGSPDGLLGWRTRVAWAVAPDGTVGLHRHRSTEIEPIGRCPLGVPAVAPAPQQLPTGIAGAEAVAPDDRESSAGEPTVLGRFPTGGRRAPHGRGRRPAQRTELLRGPERVRRTVGTQTWEVDPASFWQVHPAALDVLWDAVRGALAPAAGERALDLYAGAGAFTALLASAVGSSGRVVGVESARAAVAEADRHLARLPQADVRHGTVDAATVRALGRDVRPDLVLLDPPRAGAGAGTMRALLALRPRGVAYVSCDAATLARDVAVARASGWRLAGLRVFDAFPMTAHVECLAALLPE